MAPTPILLTGVTGGLGAKVLHDLLHIHKLPPSSIIATSRSESNRSRFESQGVQFHVADFKRPETLETAFANVENLLFMSSSERDTPTRVKEHANVIEAAKTTGVKKVWYVSLAFGGFENTSEIGFQQAHYRTEELLKTSGLDFISLRAGVYSDAFPIFLNWYPSSEVVHMPNITPPVAEGKIAFTTRDELGEAMATVLAKGGLSAFPTIQPKTDRNIVLLTAGETNSLVDSVGAINRGRETDIPIAYLEPREWIETEAKDDEGGKTKAWFEARLVFTQGVCNGDAAAMDPALEIFLGRRPETGNEAVERIVKSDPGYTWHQNHNR